jgi:hypothetical protein
MIGRKRVPTDVVVASALILFQPPAPNAANTQRLRGPIKMGLDIGVCHPDEKHCYQRGTAGAVVQTWPDEKKYLLSAGHVMDKSGNDIIQPSTGENHDPPQIGVAPNPRDNIGTVVKVLGTAAPPAAAIALGFAGPLLMSGIDAGFAECNFASPEIVSLGFPNDPISPIVSLTVQKSGATTGLTDGKIIYTNATAYNSFAQKSLFPPKAIPTSKGLFFIESTPGGPFSMPGDSGSLIVAGSSNNSDDFGEAWSLKLQKAMALDAKNGTNTAQYLKDKVTRAALGLLLGGNEIVVEEPPDSGKFVMKSVTWGQEIRLPLNAFSADLITN